MLLHDIASCGNVILGYTANYHIPGIFALFLHDFSDIFVNTTKGLSETRFKTAAMCGFFSMLLALLFLRLIMFPYAYFNFYFRHPFTPTSIPTYNFFILAVLHLLHIYWFIMCLQILWGFRKGKFEDTVTNAKDIKEDKKDK